MSPFTSEQRRIILRRVEQIMQNPDRHIFEDAEVERMKFVAWAIMNSRLYSEDVR